MSRTKSQYDGFGSCISSILKVKLDLKSSEMIREIANATDYE